MLLLMILCYGMLGQTYAQFLFPESYIILPIDTNKRNAGVIGGSFKSHTQKRVITEYQANSEFAHRFTHNNILTVVSNIGLIRNGEQTILSGGYVFTRYRHHISRNFYPEYMVQYQWMEVRGLEHKVAVTYNWRYRFIRTENTRLAIAGGLMGEYEDWSYRGVPEERLVLEPNTDNINVFNPRFNGYLSYDQQISERATLDMALYYNVRMFSPLLRTRYGAHAAVRVKISKHLQFRSLLRIMNDLQPVVPVTNWWHQFNNELVLSF
jgi:hypothetical protein